MFFSHWLELWYLWNSTRWARSRVCKPKLRQERNFFNVAWIADILPLCTQRWRIWIAFFLKEFNLIFIRTMTNGSFLIVKTQLSSWIWSFRLTLRPVSGVLNIICEWVSIIIYKVMQHVTASKELSIFYLACFFYSRVIHEREVSTDQAIDR